jgi:hypothetical protein
MPSASVVPSSVAATVVIAAISSDVNSDRRSVSSAKKSSYQRSENPSNVCSERAELNENRITTRIGANRNA